MNKNAVKYILAGLLFSAVSFLWNGSNARCEEEYNKFTQNKWNGGISTTNAADPANKTGWTKYYSKSDNLIVNSDGKLTLSALANSILDDTDTDFAKGTFSNIQTSGSGSSAVLGLSTNYEDPFFSGLGEWAIQPLAPYMGRTSPLVKAGSYIYSLWQGNAENKTFARWSIADEKWEIMADIPIGTGQGAALAWDGSDIIYALVGGGRKEFYAYQISTNSWYQKANLTSAVTYGGAIVIVPSISRAYAFCGGGGSIFLRYVVPSSISSVGSWSAVESAPFSVGIGSSLVYPKADSSYIYAFAGNSSSSCAKFDYTASSNAWTSTANCPSTLAWDSNVVYPGTGDYLYAWNGNTRWFGRYYISSDVWESSSYASSPAVSIEMPSLPFYIYGNMWIYDAIGDGTELRLLSNHSYSSTYRYYPSTKKWREESTVRSNGSWGRDCVYVASENAIYYMPGGNSLTFYKYYLDFTPVLSSNTAVAFQWEQLASASFSGNSTGVYIGGCLAYEQGSNYIYCLQGYYLNGFSRYNLTTKAWEQLTAIPQKVYWGGSLVAAGGYIYATGGHNNDTGSYTSNLYRYDPSAGTWTSISNCTYGAFYYGTCMAYDGSDYIYMLRTNSRSAFIRYRISTGTWESRATLPDMYVGYQGKLVYNSAENSIYYLTGHDSQLYRGFCKYNISSNSWTTLSYPAFQYLYIAACASSFKLYCLGMDTSGFQTYTFSSASWSNPVVNAAFSYDRNVFGNVVVKDDDAYVFSNYRSGYAWRYSISNKRWAELIKLPFFTQGYGHKAVYPGSGNYIYVSEGNMSKAFWKYNTSTKVWTQLNSSPYVFSYGARITGDSSGIYVCPGYYNSTVFLKFTDDESGGSWNVLTSMLESIYNEGNGTCIISSGTYKGVYMLRQNGAVKFTKYNLDSDTWTYLADAPWSISEYCYLMYPGTGDFLYCLKGSGRDFAKYSLSGNTWTTLTEAPLSVPGCPGGFYPGSGDVIYFYLGPGRGGVGNNFNRYSISENRWDEPIVLPASYSYGGQICTMPSGEEVFYLVGGGSTSVYKYNLTSAVWSSLQAVSASIYYDAKAVYPGTGDDIYVTRGTGYYDFWKYTCATDMWTNLAAPPATFSTGVSMAYKDNYLYVLRGGSTNTFWRYALATNDWAEMATAPTVCSRGANLIYPGSGNYLYACAGNGTTAFWKYDPTSGSTGAWTTLTPLPQASYGGLLFSPGFGDYIYYFVSYNYDFSYGTPYFYRYCISTNTWETRPNLPFCLNGQASALYPGTGDCVYLAGGYGTYSLMKYLLFSSGTYISDIKEIGNNTGFGAITWTDNSLGQIDVKVRTGNNSSLSDALSWAYAGKAAKNSDLSDCDSVTDKDKYLQYYVRFFCYDLTQPPQLDKLSLVYNTYPLQESLISSAYNTGTTTNRNKRISWTSTLPTGTDIRFQMRTAPDSNGSPGTWSAWLGPAGIQQVTYNFENSGEYANTSEVVVSNGAAKLSKILEDYLYRQKIIIDNSSGASSYTNTTIKVDIPETNIDFWEHVADDGSDIRFTDSDGKTPLSYRVLGFSKSKRSASCWVTVPSIPSATAKNIYLLYGKSTATSESDSSLAESLIGSEFYGFMFAFFDIVSTDAPNRVYIEKLNASGSVIASTYLDFTSVGQKQRYDDTDLTVYHIYSQKPITVFSSSIEPTSTSDDDFYTVCGNDLWLWCPAYNYDGDVIITAYNDDTQIKITDHGKGDDTGTLSLDTGNFWFGWNRVDTNGEVWHIEATKPITVMAGLIANGDASEQMRSPDMQDYYFYCPDAYITVTGYMDNTSYLIDNLDSVTGDYSGVINKGESYKHIPGTTTGLTMRTHISADNPLCVVADDMNGGKAQIYQSSDTLVSVGKEYYINTGGCRYLRLVSLESGANNITLTGDISPSPTSVSLSTIGSLSSIDPGSNWRNLHLSGTKKFAVYSYSTSGEAITPVMKTTEFNRSLSSYLTAYESSATSANSALSGWLYKETIKIDNTDNSSDLTSFQVAVDVDKNHTDFWQHCLSTGADVRFVDEDDNTLLDYFIESFTYSSKTARFWVKIPSLSHTALKTIYMYYGKSGAVSLSNGSNVFEFFDDFDGDLGLWNSQYANLTTISSIFGMDSVTFTAPAATNTVSTTVTIPTGVLASRTYDWYWELRWSGGALVQAQTIAQPFTLTNDLMTMTDGPYMSNNLTIPSSVSVSSASWSSYVATITTSAAHNLAVGQQVTLSGITPTTYNGTYTVASVVSTTKFTVALATSVAGGSGGTMQAGPVVTGLGGIFTNKSSIAATGLKYRFTLTDVDTSAVFNNIDSTTFSIPVGINTSITSISLPMPPGLTKGHLYYWSWKIIDQDNNVVFTSADAPAALFNIACGFAISSGPVLPSSAVSGGSSQTISGTFANTSGSSINNLFWRFTLTDTTLGGRSVVKVAHNGYIQSKTNLSPSYDITTEIIWQTANKTGNHFMGICDPNAVASTGIGNNSFASGYDVLLNGSGYYYDQSGNGYNTFSTVKTAYTSTSWNKEKLTWTPNDTANGITGKVVFSLASGDKLTYNAGFVAGPGLAIRPTVRSSSDAIYIDKIMVHKSATVTPYVGFVFNEESNPSGMDVYYETNPVIQPVLGVFYDSNLTAFQESIVTPSNTAVKYQVSNDGYNWYWWDGSAWAQVSGGFSQTNTASDINSHLADFVTALPSGEFFFRAYLDTTDGIYTPQLDTVTVITTSEPTYYITPAGSSINTLSSDTVDDQWIQYKAILNSYGQEPPVLQDVKIEYLQAKLTITAPNGGESLPIGRTALITWTSQGIDESASTVKIEYSVDGGNSWLQISSSQPNNGAYEWTVPNNASPTSLIRITCNEFPGIKDVSDAVFGVMGLIVTSPNGGCQWEIGSSHKITWSSYGTVSNNLAIKYTRDGGSTWTTLTDQRINSGSYTWNITNSTALISDNCLVRIIDSNNTNIVDNSDAVFAIVPIPAITLTAPNGGEIWKAGATQNITWTNTGNVNTLVDIYSSTDSGSTWTVLQSGVANSGTYSCVVPNVLTSQARIKVAESAVPSGRDTQTKAEDSSNADFTITIPTIDIASPNGAEKWVSGDTRDITWTSDGAIGENSLKIEYSRDAGATWVEISSGEADDGAYSWPIPAAAVGEEVSIRIADTSRPEVKDTSDDYFQVLDKPIVVLNQPNGGEKTTIGAAYEVKWFTIGDQLDDVSFNVYFSSDSGATWTLVSDQRPNDGSYFWTPPEMEITTARIKIKCDDTDNFSWVEDESDADFEIQKPQLTLTWPNGGETLFATGTYSLTWQSLGTIGANAVKLEYSTDGGTTWNIIDKNLANSGTYSWKVADAATSQLKIRISDETQSGVSDASDANNSVVAPSITITSPNGSELWVVGLEYPITWISTGDHSSIRNNLTLQYSSDNGSTWKNIATGVANEGTYTWTVPNSIAGKCLVKIYDYARPATVDTSDAVFQIAAPSVIVTSPNGGEVWPYGTIHSVTWNVIGQVSDNVTISYSKDGGTNWITIYSGTTSNHSYDWTIPENISSTCKVKIKDNEPPYIEDTTDSVFSISYPIITITRPNGGEIFAVTDNEDITWTTNGTVSNSLKIEYSRDNFVLDVNEIADNVPNTGMYVWTVPEVLSTILRVRITDNAAAQITDKSNASFSILPFPVLTLDAPNGGETWRIGTVQEIKWHDNSGPVSNNLKLEYSVDGGTTWKSISTGVSNSGTYSWTIPDDYSVSAKVRITDTLRATSTDESNSVFSIEVPKITVTSPATGTYWAVGDEATVTWTSEGSVSNNLVLQYSTDNFTTFTGIAVGETNDGSYAWAVPDEPTSNMKIRIVDGNRPATMGVSSAFSVLSYPEVTVTTPNGGEEYVVGDTVDITWTSKGLKINPLTIVYSADNFATSYTIKTGVSNTGKYVWTIADDVMAVSTLKIKIYDPARTVITDTSNNTFRIRGGFNITYPTENAEWAVNEPRSITWETKGQVPNVKLEYTVDDGATWSTIVSSAANKNTYSWTPPDYHGQQAKIRVSDSTDSTVYSVSKAFNIIYYQITWQVKDYDNMDNLQNLGVRDTWWTDSSATIICPVTHEYPYGHYTTFWSKEGYIERSTDWTADANKSITLLLENSISAQIEWHVLLSTAYNSGTDTINASSWLERRGKIVGLNDTDRADLASATLSVYDGDTLVKTMTSTTPDSNGVFWFTWANTGLSSGKTYFVKSTIVFRDSSYNSGASIDITSALTAKSQTAILQSLQTQAAIIQSQVTQDIPQKITEAKEEIKADTAKILTATQTDIPQKIEESRQQQETEMKSEILNRETSVRSGTDMVVRYRTYPGVQPTLDFYDPDNVQRVAKGAMTEVSSGIYEYTISLSSSWGRGDFTIVCSESTYGSLDAMIISVIRSDIEQVAGQVSAVLGSTSGLNNFTKLADTLNSQFAVIESALGKISKDLVDQVKEVAGSATDINSVYMQLVNIGKQLKEVSTEQNVSLEKLLEVNEEKKNDMNYLKNKTQELKAVMDVNQKMIDNMANKPVTQTWFEFK